MLPTYPYPVRLNIPTTSKPLRHTRQLHLSSINLLDKELRRLHRSHALVLHVRGEDNQRAGAYGVAVVAEDGRLVRGEAGDAAAVLLVLGVAE